MGITKTLGGDRLGSGKKMKVHLHGYERSTHNMSYLWRSTMSAGTLVPFICEVGLPGDTFDIDLDCDIKTHPTVGPLFGSYKIQLDTFLCPMRLYQGKLHNNKLGIGLDMASVKLPVIELGAKGNGGNPIVETINIDNNQINPSCILSYLGIRGIGDAYKAAVDDNVYRLFNAIPLLAYWDIYKNYYANKQETDGYVVHTQLEVMINSMVEMLINNVAITEGEFPPPPFTGVNTGDPFTIEWVGTAQPLDQIIIHTSAGNILASTAMENALLNSPFWIGTWSPNVGPVSIFGWDYLNANSNPINAPRITPFPISEIDDMREFLLSETTQAAAVNISSPSGGQFRPYRFLLDVIDEQTGYKFSQEGLAIKTYQSDLFNNWLNEEFIDGTNGINEITAIDTTGGSFTLDTLNLSKKVYEMLNRIAVSGGTYDDWLDAVYTHERHVRMETPVYQGGLIRELVFQEVVSNAEAGNDTTEEGIELGRAPLGTLAGKGILGHKKKGGSVTIKVDEPCYIIGLISLTPRIDYSQGNKWDVHLKTMDDLHKPALDEIGFQDLITEQMAWWDTTWDETTQAWIQRSAGKQPAWINYMTNVNKVYGNFAEVENEMFMTLNRRYEREVIAGPISRIKDLTSYIDPVKFNYSFARTAIDAQNFWAQISVDMIARRKMSAKIMPNL